MMNTKQIREAIAEANITMRAADLEARGLAEALEGRLRQVTKGNYWSDHNLLVRLKRELSQYDAKKRKWKN